MLTLASAGRRLPLPLFTLSCPPPPPPRQRRACNPQASKQCVACIHAQAPLYCPPPPPPHTHTHTHPHPPHLSQVINPDIEEVVGGGESSPQLLGWIDVADVLRAFLQRERAGHAQPAVTSALQHFLSMHTAWAAWHACGMTWAGQR